MKALGAALDDFEDAEALLGGTFGGLDGPTHPVLKVLSRGARASQSGVVVEAGLGSGVDHTGCRSSDLCLGRLAVVAGQGLFHGTRSFVKPHGVVEGPIPLGAAQFLFGQAVAWLRGKGDAPVGRHGSFEGSSQLDSIGKVMQGKGEIHEFPHAACSCTEM